MDHKGYTMLDENEESWSLEKLCTEDFHVDDLLDLGGIASDLEDHHEEEQEEDIHSSSTIASALSNHSPTLGDEPISVPEGDISDLEWVSHFVDDSVPFFPPPQQQLQENQRLHFLPNPRTAPGTSNSRTPSSPSVASISSPAVCAYPTLSRNFSSETFLVRCKTRTKRSRRVWSLSRPELGDPLCSSSSSCSSCSSASSSSCLVYEPHSLSPEVLPLVLLEGKATGRPPLHSNPEGKKKKKKGKKGKLAAAVLTAVALEGGFGGRRCSHCGVQKTPQWRTGPMGAKTLCNACGVRYKSGRLLPEYRPACSPTFVSHVHSNSHRKVLELRREKEVLRLPSAAVVAAPSNVNFYSSG